MGGPGVNVCTTACVAGTADGTEGSINTAFGLAVNAQGTVFIAEQGTSRVSMFSTQGAFQGILAHPGPAAGQVISPNGVAVGPDGTIYVADTTNARLDVFIPIGSSFIFQRALGFNVIPGGPIAADECTVLCQSGSPSPIVGVGGFAELRAVATDCRGAVYAGTLGRVDKYAEPGTATPPCPPPPPPAPTPPAKPSNAFAFGKGKGNKKKGTLTIPISLPGAGSLVATAGKKFSVKAPQPIGAGTVNLTVKATGKGLKTLSSKGKLKGTLKVTFTPTGGDAGALSLKFTLVKKRAHKARSHRAGK